MDFSGLLELTSCRQSEMTLSLSEVPSYCDAELTSKNMRMLDDRDCPRPHVPETDPPLTWPL